MSTSQLSWRRSHANFYLPAQALDLIVSLLKLRQG